MPTIETRAGTVAYAERGEGPAVLLLHATLHDHHDYDAVAPVLAEQARVIAVDWPGHGESAPAGPHPAGGPWFAGVLEDVIDGLGLTDVAVIGNSVGGYAASRLAIHRPEQVRAVVLVNAAGFTPVNPMTRAFCGFLGRPAVTARLLPHLIPRYMRPRSDLDRRIVERAVARARTPEGTAVAADLWRSFNDPAYDLRAQAGAHRAPTLMVWGMRDAVLGARAGREAKRRLPDAEFVGLATGHVPFSSDPEGFLAAVGPFLARHRSAPGLAADHRA